MKPCIAIIPARGGSKGLPGKNKYPLLGRPLIDYSIRAASDSNCFTDIVVSSDDQEILDIALNRGVAALRRSPENSSDTATSASVVLEVLGELFVKEGVFVLLQPTSPLRTATHIQNALKLFMSTQTPGLISVYEPRHHPLKSLRIDELGHLRGLVDDRHPFSRRQDLPEALNQNGAIYCLRIDAFIKDPSFLPKGTIPFLMKEEESIDIDNLLDIETAEFYMERQKKKA
ncbi:MAG: hypothetical protein A2293_07225 [Elusimicrobia bacterium RIFOXYB2_FULL_49_7]|nr:MAG: hypothetical protein A2293_07225 [Elusimicrobia bacterium RIFOXYB2_FULL_49_7]